ncbi:hypothetical protein CLG_B2261 [Clostridium botulinum D str. 1873]|uniref:Uncharacterized protein n=1 Tax=Clostridium botulinum D str. 1873 TaxID=592027 RepID=A0A9P2G8R6_CLOBO|nr:hypothetical protein CLG_B2267 [Clostridium botulinum D str. 1873]EES92055.1 hypothetical protein CLG_B2261 [Clostridium botulinum D str. 1873]
MVGLFPRHFFKLSGVTVLVGGMSKLDGTILDNTRPRRV